MTYGTTAGPYKGRKAYLLRGPNNTLYYIYGSDLELGLMPVDEKPGKEALIQKQVDDEGRTFGAATVTVPGAAATATEAATTITGLELLGEINTPAPLKPVYCGPDD